MSPDSIHGVISYPDEARGNDYLFRLALKAFVLNYDGELLLVKERGRDWWDIPGGGLDHGESIKEGLARELYEEVGYSGDFSFEPLEVSEPQVLSTRSIIQVRVTFLVKTENMNFKPGDDGDDVVFMNPEQFRDSEIRTEQEIYRYSQLALGRSVRF